MTNTASLMALAAYHHILQKGYDYLLIYFFLENLEEIRIGTGAEFRFQIGHQNPINFFINTF